MGGGLGALEILIGRWREDRRDVFVMLIDVTAGGGRPRKKTYPSGPNKFPGCPGCHYTTLLTDKRTQQSGWCYGCARNKLLLIQLDGVYLGGQRPRYQSGRYTQVARARTGWRRNHSGVYSVARWLLGHVSVLTWGGYHER